MRPKPADPENMFRGGDRRYVYGQKDRRYGFCSSSHRRATKPHRSCHLCNFDKVNRTPHIRDRRLTQEPVAELVREYLSAV